MGRSVLVRAGWSLGPARRPPSHVSCHFRVRITEGGSLNRPHLISARKLGRNPLSHFRGGQDEELSSLAITSLPEGELHTIIQSGQTATAGPQGAPDCRLRVWPSGNPGAVSMVVPRPLGGLDRQTLSDRRHRSTYELMHASVCWMARAAIVMARAVGTLDRGDEASPRNRFSLALDRGSDCMSHEPSGHQVRRRRGC